MKKTTLTVLIALMVATPCLAQEVEPDGVFSISGTLWEVAWHNNVMGQKRGFYDNRVFEVSMDEKFGYCRKGERSFYFDLMAIAFFAHYSSSFDVNHKVQFYQWEIGVVFPLLNMGFFLRINHSISYQAFKPSVQYTFLTLEKVSNNWQPDSSCYNY